MRILLLSCALLASGVQLAFAAPSQTTIDDIQRQIHAANKMDSKIITAEGNLAAAIKAKANPASIVEFRKLVAREKDKQSAARTKVIHRIIEEYDLAPANPSGTSVYSLTKGRVIEWLPVAREREERHIQNDSGHFERQPQPRKAIAGKVYADGVAYIYPEAFTRGVGYLASTILHERIHFEQITTAGKGDKLRRAELEQEAYQAEKDNERRFFNPNIPDEKAAMDEIAADLNIETAEADRIRKERATIVGKLKDMFRPTNTQDMFESRTHTNEELADIKSLVALARSHAEAAHREKLKREASAKEAAVQASQREHDRRLRETIINLTRRSCDNPGSVSQAELSVLARPFQKEGDFRWMAPLEPRDFPGRDHCVNIYSYLAYGGRDFEKLRQAATPSERPSLVATPVMPEKEAPTSANIQANKHPFSRILPQYKSYAINACRAPAQIKWDSMFFIAYDYSYRDYDDKLIRELKNGMDDCAQKLLDYFVDIKRRTHNSDALQPAVIRDRVAAFTPVYWSPGRGGGEEPGCEYDSNIGGRICPKSR